MAQESSGPHVDRSTDVARRWLMALERCVRPLDYAAARPLFAADVIAFGTRAYTVRDRETLEREQWRPVWPSIRGFTFRLDELRCWGGEQGLCVTVPWDSLGVQPDGTTVPRPGRATVFLVPREREWVAVHSHFSLTPSPPQP
ncbi:MAG: nuclear transport factor 2 family protein [Candidatus Rokubacteria bacterium]|nr:nuclear transport factor 2 family protein [Candidatus Rokubacteria bacterium]